MADARQFGFDLGDSKPVSYEPDRAEIRAELLEILAAAKAATDGRPWDDRTWAYNTVVFPQMSRWLPDAEREQLCAEFAHEIARIERLGAV